MQAYPSCAQHLNIHDRDALAIERYVGHVGQWGGEGDRARVADILRSRCRDGQAPCVMTAVCRAVL